MDPLKLISSIYTYAQRVNSSFAILFNGLFMVALVKKKSLHTPSNAVLGCLCCNDLLIGIISMPLWILNTSIDFKSLDHNAAGHFVIISKIFYVSTGLSSLFMMLVNLDRYAAICQPFKYLQNATAKLYAVISICTFVIFVLLMSITLVIDRVYDVYSAIFILITMLLLITLSLIFCNWKIIIVILRHRRSIASVERQSVTQHSEFQRETKRYHIVVLLIIFYVLLNLPSRVSLILFVVHKTRFTDLLLIFYMVSNVLLLLNSVINPLVYCFRIRVFRSAVRDLFCCKRAT